MSVGAVAVTPRPAWKPWLAAAVGVVAAFFALGLIADAFAPAPEGPAGSSYATSPAGAAAWAELLTRSGHPVAQLRRPLDDAALPPAATLIMLGADSLSPAAGQNLDRFVRAGGRLVIGGGNPPATLPALLPRAACVDRLGLGARQARCAPAGGRRRQYRANRRRRRLDVRTGDAGAGRDPRSRRCWC